MQNTMRNAIRNTVVMSMLLCLPGMTQADEFVTSHRTVQATGIGRAPNRYQGVRARLMAERGAQVVAARNLSLKLSGDPAPAASAYAQYHSNVLRGVRYSPTIYHADGTAEVVAEVNVPSSERRYIAAPPTIYRPQSSTYRMETPPYDGTISHRTSYTTYNGRGTRVIYQRTTSYTTISR